MCKPRTLSSGNPFAPNNRLDQPLKSGRQTKMQEFVKGTASDRSETTMNKIATGRPRINSLIENLVGSKDSKSSKADLI